MRFRLLIIGVFFAALACTSSVPAAPLSPAASATPIPQPPPPPDALNGLAGLQARMTQTEDHNKFVIDEEVVVWFIPCEPGIVDHFSAPMIVYHLPSGSSIDLNIDGSVKPTAGSPRFKSEEARQRLTAVVINAGLLERIVSKYSSPGRCSPESR